MLSLGKKFLSHVMPGIIKPLRILWNEMIAFVFVIFAVMSAPKFYNAWKDFNGDPDRLFRLLLTGIFCVTMSTFAILSFLRARKISRTQS